jgi:hypothetical protein
MSLTSSTEHFWCTHGRMIQDLPNASGVFRYLSWPKCARMRAESAFPLGLAMPHPLHLINHHRIIAKQVFHNGE